MQNFRNQKGQSMAPAIEYLSQVQRIYLDSWRRLGDVGVRWTQSAMDELNHIGQDILNAPLNRYQALGEKLSDYQQEMMSMVSEAQVALARTLSDSTRATADTARNMAEQQAGQIERAGREQADAMREQAGELREQGGAMAEQAGQAAEHAQQAATPHQPGAEKREGGSDKREGGHDKREGRGKGGQDSASTMH